MASPQEKLAASLKKLHAQQSEEKIVIRSTELSRTHRERLVKNGFLTEVIKGWYIPTRPDETTGESTAWYASFWDFCADYLNYLRKNDWCLSPEQSLLIHVDNWTIPKQLLVRADKARNNIIQLPYNTSILETRTILPEPRDCINQNGLRIYTLPASLLSLPEPTFKQKQTDVCAALSLFQDASTLLPCLLEQGNSTIAGRLAGAFRHIGKDNIANDITQTMASVGHHVREKNPFESQEKVIVTHQALSPLAKRIDLLWHKMREDIIPIFPNAPDISKNKTDYIRQIEEDYISDAYHSLSIEGYRVNVDLIDKVRSGNWQPELDIKDKEQSNALAARGYWQAFNAVKNSIEKILDGQNAGAVVQKDHSTWYREMFAPSVTAGIIPATSLAGYRNESVFIRNAMHIPPSPASIRDAMPTFFELLKEEENAAARIVLGHFIFVYLHPYIDGNGRMGRFLMNTMFASGGFGWQVIKVENRTTYMEALEQASTHENIKPFATFLAGLLS